MLHKAWNSKGEVPYCFPRSSIKFQGHTGQNITNFDPNWAFPDYRPVAAFKSLRFALLLPKVGYDLYDVHHLQGLPRYTCINSFINIASVVSILPLPCAYGDIEFVLSCDGGIYLRSDESKILKPYPITYDHFPSYSPNTVRHVKARLKNGWRRNVNNVNVTSTSINNVWKKSGVTGTYGRDKSAIRHSNSEYTVDSR